MASQITKIDSETYETIHRGRIYTLVSSVGGWAMWNKTIHGRSNPPKPFSSLEAVEAHYKHWKGIVALHDNTQSDTTRLH